MNLTLRVWRQSGPQDPGRMVTYELTGISEDASFLEMLDVLNEKLTLAGDDPVTFDHDCREGICGSCGMVINGVAHGPQRATTACQLHMRHFEDGDGDRRRAVARGRVPGHQGPRRWTARRSTGSSRQVASSPPRPAPLPTRTPRRCPSPTPTRRSRRRPASAAAPAWQRAPTGREHCSLSAKVTHLALLPQGQAERDQRVLNMVKAHDDAGFGGCTNTGECTAVCPKVIPQNAIGMLNHDFRVAGRHRRD